MSMEWENLRDIPRGRVRRKVSAAVLIIDDFTGKPAVSPDIQVTAKQVTAAPVRKGDGYFLFLDCKEPVLDITAWGWAYHPVSMQVKLSELPRLRPVVKLRLTPNRNYGIPSHTTCIEGKTTPGTEFRVLCVNDPRPLRLLYDYNKNGEAEGRLIRLYDPAGSDWEGRTFAVSRQEKKEIEFCTVREKLEEQEGGCLLDAPLTGDCKKAGTVVFPVFTALADREGTVFLPLPTLAVKTYQCRIFWRTPDGVWQEQLRELEAGRVNRLELADGT